MVMGYLTVALTVNKMDEVFKKAEILHIAKKVTNINNIRFRAKKHIVENKLKELREISR